MFGWTLIKGKNINNEADRMKLIKEIHSSDESVYIYQNHFPKFENDKINYEDDDYYILVDGVIFNNHELVKKFQAASWSEAFKTMMETDFTNAINDLRGTFNGFVLNKKDLSCRFFTNHIAEREVFYYNKDGILLVSSNYNHLVDLLKANNVKYEINDYAVKSMLAYAHMIYDNTYVKNVKRLLAGSILSYRDGNAEIIKYHTFDAVNREKLTYDEYIEQIEKTFSRAMKLEFDKDREYGYRSIIDISGGYDSRTVAFAAKRFGYKDVIYLSYSQVDSNENKVANIVMKKLNNEYYYRSMDNPTFIYDIDKIIKQNYGLTYYGGITAGRQILERINHFDLGMEHTGLLGDVYEGSFSSQPYEQAPAEYPRYRFNKNFDFKIKEEYIKPYKNFEDLSFHMRGLNFGLGTHLIRRNYNETFSPFMDVDVLDLMFKIPLETRMEYKIYLHWLKKYYPEAQQIIYAKTLTRHPGNKFLTKLSSRLKVGIPVRLNLLLVKLGLKKAYNNVSSMNPFDYWYRTNPDVRNFINEYIEKNIHILKRVPGLEEVANNALNASIMDKLVIMTPIQAIKEYFGEE